ncbi:MAG: hypothetical protein PVJ38_06265 [Candidatus Bathyarchaeota archaeon]|jgi:hypothetical protein
MPSQATNYFYTIVCMGVIALMVTNAFKTQVVGLKTTSEREELKRILEAVASEATELIAFSKATNVTSQVSIHTPSLIGYRRYWVRLQSDGSGAWVEGAFGDPWEGNPDLKFELPEDVTISGTYRGGYGTLTLNCTTQGEEPSLILGRWKGG